MDDEQRGFGRLRDEQMKAIHETNKRIQQLETFMNDYKVLQTRLGTLPDKVTHDIMVPFGKFGFMPGQMVHTNEILVLLGDNWFTERSAKQAGEITERRINAIKDQIDQLKQQRGLLEPRLEFSSEMDNLLQHKEDMVEIKEEYDEEKEAQWREQHRENVRAHKKQSRSAADDTTLPQAEAHRTHSGPESSQTDDAIWKRLNELELQERKNREMIRDIPSDDNKSRLTNFPLEMDSSQMAGKSAKDKVTGKPGVRWKDQEDESDSDGEESWEDEDEYEEGDEGSSYSDDSETAASTTARTHKRPATIAFSHSNTSQQSSQVCVTTDTQQGAPSILSPADIYRQFVEPARDQPKSILKSPSSTTRPMIPSAETSVHSSHHVENTRELNPNSPEAFTGAVVEKVSSSNDSIKVSDTSTMSSQASEPSYVTNIVTEPRKRMSRFKARKIQKDS